MMLLSLHSQDQINMSPSVTNFYKKIALECSSQQIAIWTCLCVPHNTWTWLPSVRAQYTVAILLSCLGKPIGMLHIVLYTYNVVVYEGPEIASRG